MTLFDYLCELYVKAGGDPKKVREWREEVIKGSRDA